MTELGILSSIEGQQACSQFGGGEGFFSVLSQSVDHGSISVVEMVTT